MSDDITRFDEQGFGNVLIVRPGFDEGLWIGVELDPDFPADADESTMLVAVNLDDAQVDKLRRIILAPAVDAEALGQIAYEAASDVHKAKWGQSYREWDDLRWCTDEWNAAATAVAAVQSRPRPQSVAMNALVVAIRLLRRNVMAGPDDLHEINSDEWWSFREDVGPIVDAWPDEPITGPPDGQGERVAERLKVLADAVRHMEEGDQYLYGHYVNQEGHDWHQTSKEMLDLAAALTVGAELEGKQE